MIPNIEDRDLTLSEPLSQAPGARNAALAPHSFDTRLPSPDDGQEDSTLPASALEGWG